MLGVQVDGFAIIRKQWPWTFCTVERLKNRALYVAVAGADSAPPKTCPDYINEKVAVTRLHLLKTCPGVKGGCQSRGVENIETLENDTGYPYKRAGRLVPKSHAPTAD
jgi:hypothetical protein